MAAGRIGVKLATSTSNATKRAADKRGELLPLTCLGELAAAVKSGLKVPSSAKGDTRLPRTSKPHPPGDRHAERGGFSRVFFLRRILRTQFALRGTQPTQEDADISTKWSEETMKVLEASGAAGLALQRPVQPFASVTLLGGGKKPKPEHLAPFLEDIMGSGGTFALSGEDWDALNAARAKMRALIADAPWSMVHGGHSAMSCLTLLPLYDISLLNAAY